jgi:hypothetical protein
MTSSKSLSIHVLNKTEPKGVLVSLGNVGGREMFPALPPFSSFAFKLMSTLALIMLLLKILKFSILECVPFLRIRFLS